MLSFSRRRGAHFLSAAALGSLIVVGWAACGSSVDSHGTGGSAGAGGATHAGGSTPNGGSTPTGGGTNNGGSTMSGGGSGQGGNAGTCDAACTAPFKCCGDACIAPYNDIFNCGACGKKCTGAHPYCDQGHCANSPPCADGGTICDGPGFCCGSTCCNENELCCDVPGEIETGPKCVTLDQGQTTCPQGCPLCG